MKYIFLALVSCSLICTPAQAEKSFFSEHTKMIAGGALGGSLAGLSACAIGGSIYQSIVTKSYQPEFNIDSMAKAQIVVAVLAGCALLGGVLGNKAENDFEAHKFESLIQAQERFAAFKKNKSIKNALACLDITEVEAWFKKADHKKSYNHNAPLISAFDFLREWRDELIKLNELNEKLSHYFEGQELAAIESDLESIHSYIVQLNGLLVILVPHTPRTSFYAAPVRGSLMHSHTNKVSASLVHSHAPVKQSPACTISPVLNGNVYGTIWSNY